MPGFVPATQFDESQDFQMRFPPLPRTVSEVTRLLTEPSDTPDTERLTEIVEIDPLVVTAVLRRINSAYYGLRRMIGDIHKAVFLLGFLEVSNIVLTEGMMKLRNVIHSDEQARIFNHIMRLSLATADLAQDLAFSLKLPGKASAFTAGLLHNVGRLVLLYNRPNDYEALWWSSDHGSAPSIDEERAIFGIDHARLGGMAGEKWNLPVDLAAVVESYARPEMASDGATQTLAGIVNVASAAADQLFRTEDRLKFQAPGTLHALAQKTGTRTPDLIRMVEERSATTREFVNSAMHSA